MQRALLEDPAHDHTRDEVERLARTIDGWAPLANTYADVLSNGAEKETKLFIGKSLARLYEEELGDIERSEATCRFILGLGRLAIPMRLSHWTAFIPSMRRMRLSARCFGAGSTRRTIRMTLCGSATASDRCSIEILGRTDEAIGVYNHILSSHEAEHIESIHALERIYTERADWPHLYGTFEKELEVALGDTAQATIHAKMARLASDRLGSTGAGD